MSKKITLSIRSLLPFLLGFFITLIVAGIVIFAVFGMNTSPDKPTRHVLDVRYDKSINFETGDKNDETLQNFVENALSGKGISFEKEIVPEFSSTSDSGSGSMLEDSYVIARYEMTGGDAAAYQSVADAVNTEIAAHIGLNGEKADIYYYADASASYYETTLLAFDPDPSAWRAAIAVSVGAIVMLVYVTFRFGIASGVAGLVTCFHDALLTLALVTLFRIPVFAAAPALYAAIAMLVSAVLWMLFAHKLRTNYKEPTYAALPADDVVERTRGEVWKWMLLCSGLFAAVVLVIGAVGAVGTMNLILPALLSAVVPLYSTLCVGPAVFASIRKRFDKKEAARNRVYVGKKKKAESEQE